MHKISRTGGIHSFSEQMRQAAKQIGPDGAVLAHYRPVAGNPYLRMLYARSFEHGFSCVPVFERDQLDELVDISDLGVPVFVHYHWVHVLFDKLKTARSARKAARRFIETVKRQQDAGHKTLWTVHNILSHANRFPDEEIYLRQTFADTVDYIHIMNPASETLCGAYYTLPADKVFASPHPSYAGVYGAYISREQARLDMGVAEDEKVLLSFGSLGPYKGVRHFLNVWEQARTRLGGKARLVVAGKPSDEKFLKELKRLAYHDRTIMLVPQHIDDQQVQAFFKAADLVICPYQRTLNSGVIMTAATFGRTLVLPEQLLPILDGLEGGYFTFDAGNIDTILPALVEAVDQGRCPEVRDRIIGWARDREPAASSDRFFRALNGMLV